MKNFAKRYAPPIHLPHFIRHAVGRGPRRSPGAPPGIEHLPSASEAPPKGFLQVTCIDFSGDRHEQRIFDSIDELDAYERPEWSTTRWIDVQGLHPYALRLLQRRFAIHPLAAEDALNVPQRPKVEDYDDSLYVVMKMLRMDTDKLINEQVSFFYFPDTVITIQEQKGDVWDTVRARMEKPGSRFRKYGAPYLLYALLDAIVDHLFPLLDHYFEELNKLEDQILEDPHSALQNRVHSLKRELSVLRQSIWPIRDVVSSLLKDEFELFPESVETYLRDVFDHTLQANEQIEMYREAASGLQDLLMAATSNRTNEIVKALTIMASLFLPLTFFAGVYGMNFEHFPELSWPWAYPAFWAISLATVALLLSYFRRKGWIGK